MRRLRTYALLLLWTLVVARAALLGADHLLQGRRATSHNGPFYMPFVDFSPSLDAWNFMLLENNTLGPYLNSVVVALGSTTHRAC